MRIQSFEMFESSSSSQLTQKQIDWCNKHIKEKWKVNLHGEIEVEKNVSFKNIDFDIFPVKFAPVKGNFDCDGCTNLTSLEGAPSSVRGSFYCSSCTSLTSLKGAPSSVGGSFYCIGCTSLTSLEGAPSLVGGDFDCDGCTSLTSLKGAPTSVRGSFYCSSCISLTSLEGVPSSVGKSFYCIGCTNLTSLEGAPSLVDGGFYCIGCTSLPLEQAELASNSDLLKKWLKSRISAKEFLHKNRGLIAGKKFGL